MRRNAQKWIRLDLIRIQIKLLISPALKMGFRVTVSASSVGPP